MSENATPMTERVENHQNIKMKMQITKKYNHRTTTRIFCGIPASATQMTEEVRKNKYIANMESPTKNQIQCKYGKKKNKSNANMESPITILWNVSKPRPDDREALRAGSAHSKPKTVTDVCLQMQEQIQIQSQFQIQKYNWKCKA